MQKKQSRIKQREQKKTEQNDLDAKQRSKNETKTEQKWFPAYDDDAGK